MFSFAKRAPRGELPAVLKDSILLTTGLQGAIRSQYIMAGMTAFGLIMGAVLAAWLVGFAPAAWNAVTFTAPGSATLTVLAWVSRGVGVLMGAVIGASFFRHVTYTVVAKSLLTLRAQHDITEAERAWLNFELASMAHYLKKSDWQSNQPFVQESCTLIWLGFAFFALTGLTTVTPETWMMTAQLFVFLMIFMAGWSFIYKAPADLADCNFEAACSHVKGQLDAKEPLTAVLTHAQPLYRFVGSLVALAVIAVVMGVATRALDSELHTKAQNDAIFANLDQIYANLENAKDAPREKLLVSLGASQYIGDQLKWSVFANRDAALAANTPFVSRNCENLTKSPMHYDSDGPWLCSIAGEKSHEVLKNIFVKQLSTEEDWLRFRFARRVPQS